MFLLFLFGASRKTACRGYTCPSKFPLIYIYCKSVKIVCIILYCLWDFENKYSVCLSVCLGPILYVCYSWNVPCMDLLKTVLLESTIIIYLCGSNYQYIINISMIKLLKINTQTYYQHSPCLGLEHRDTRVFH